MIATVPDLSPLFAERPPASWSLPPRGDEGRIAAQRTRWLERAAALPEDPGREMRGLLEDERGAPLLDCLFGYSSYLTDCALREPGLLRNLLDRGPEPVRDVVLGEVRGLAADAGITSADLATALRGSKRRLALLVAVADVARLWSLEEVCAALSAFADAALDASLAHLLRGLGARGKLDLAHPDRPCDGSGVTILGLGKLGAEELNYSSDIDLIVLFDPKVVRCADPLALPESMVRLTRDLLRLMDERTADGYVFRTDLRLRPDPGATPLALSVPAALSYYETVGQNWERAAMIRARPVAGDRRLGERFLRELRPFVWRRHLDFYAIRDVRSIARQIEARHRADAPGLEGHNIKLGRGGIRQIEFFVQTQQLIFGGRDANLRTRRTCDALRALAAAGIVEEVAAAALSRSYAYLRRLEHRLQMVADQQTHSLPTDTMEMERIARFFGCAETAAFRRTTEGVLGSVETYYSTLFEDEPPLARQGNLVFTGSEPEPETLETLRRLGFADGAQVFQRISAWHHGRYRATRAERARQYLTELVPTLLEAFGRVADPDAALARFDAFLASLPAGVQLFSLLQRNPALLTILVEIMGSSPAMAERLARRPALLEALLLPAPALAAPSTQAFRDELETALQQARDLEDSLDLTRRWAADERFLIGLKTLRGAIDAETAGQALSDVAESCIVALFSRVRGAFEEAHGRLPQGEMAILALGRLGAREMTLASDLDLVFLYQTAGEHAESDGRRPLAASLYYGRLAQRLITALTAMTGEGGLYEVDTRLRPSGASGPIALSLRGFVHYQWTQAWTWEHMALTKARVVCGDEAIGTTLREEIGRLLAAPRDPDGLLLDVADMRERLAREKPAQGLFDLKRLRGGLTDLDFLARTLQLRHASAHAELLWLPTARVFEGAAAAGILREDLGAFLASCYRRDQAVLQFLRLTIGDRYDALRSPTLAAALAEAAGALDFAALEDSLSRGAEGVMQAYAELVGEPARRLREQPRYADYRPGPAFRENDRS